LAASRLFDGDFAYFELFDEAAFCNFCTSTAVVIAGPRAFRVISFVFPEERTP
jgi:uncharacterized membrane protein